MQKYIPSISCCSLSLFPRCSSWPGCHPSCLQPLFIRQKVHHPGRDAQPSQPHFTLIATALTRKTSAAMGCRDSCNPPARAGSRMSPCPAPTYPVRTVPIAWHKPSWAGPVVPLSTQHWDLVIIASDDLLKACSTGPGRRGRRIRGGRFLKRKETVTGQWPLPIRISHWGSCLPPLDLPEMRNEITRQFSKAEQSEGCSSLHPFSSVPLCL